MHQKSHQFHPRKTPQKRAFRGMVSIRSATDYSPFGVQLENRNVLKVGLAEDYRMGFQGQEEDDEVKGDGNSIDFGNRMYGPRLGKLLSLDAFASKYPNISPYAFVANNPLLNIEIGGDSVLFFSSSGATLGYSFDNKRYKDKNLVVVIADKDIENFNREYNRKRSQQYKEKNKLSGKQVEAHVAGLEAMGTTYDVTSMFKFYDEKHSSNNEWGVFLTYETNPYYSSKKNWVVLNDDSKKYEGTNTFVQVPSEQPENVAAWLHTHTDDSKSDGFSRNDKENNVTSSKNSDLNSFVVIALNNSLQIQLSSLTYDSSGKDGPGFAITKSSFKNKGK